MIFYKKRFILLFCFFLSNCRTGENKDVLDIKVDSNRYKNLDWSIYFTKRPQGQKNKSSKTKQKVQTNKIK